MKHPLRTLFPLLGVCIILLVWHLIFLFSDSLFLPSPFDVIKTLGLLLTQEQILKDMLATLGRIFVSLALAISIAIPLGLILGMYSKIYDLFAFVIDFLRSIPPPTLFPLFMVLIGLGNAAKIIPTALTCSFYLLINTMYGVRNVKKLRIRVGQIWGLSKLKMMVHILIPEAAPYIAAGLRLAISISIIVVILSEMFAGTTFGIGQRILYFQLLYDIPEMYAMILLAGLLGYTLNTLYLALEHRFIHWSGK